MTESGHRPIRIGVIGVGQIGKHHLNNYAKIPDAKVVAICDIDVPELNRVAQLHNITDTYVNFRDLIKRDDIEAVDVCVHNNIHAPITIPSLEAGKHVYCEKPMAGSYADAEAMYRTAQATGRKLNIQLSTLFSKEVRAAKYLIDLGKVGHIYHARSVGIRRRGRPYVDGYGSMKFVQKEIAAGGALYDMGVYHIAAMLYLLGNPAVETISGQTYQETEMDAGRKQLSGYNVEELGVGFVRLGNNLTMDIIESWAIHMDMPESSMLAGSDGGIRLNPFGYYQNMGDVELNSTVNLDSYAWRHGALRENPDAVEGPQQHWIAALQGRVELLPSAELALKTMLISEGMYLSGRTGHEVTADEVREKSKSSAVILP